MVSLAADFRALRRAVHVWRAVPERRFFADGWPDGARDAQQPGRQHCGGPVGDGVLYGGWLRVRAVEFSRQAAYFLLSDAADAAATVGGPHCPVLLDDAASIAGYAAGIDDHFHRFSCSALHLVDVHVYPGYSR